MGSPQISVNIRMSRLATCSSSEHLPKLSERDFSFLQSCLPMSYFVDKNLHLIKSWHNIQNCKSIHLFLSLQDYDFSAVIVTENGAELIKNPRSGFDFIKISSQWKQIIQGKSYDEIMTYWIPFLNTEIRMPIVKKISDGHIVQLNVGSLLGGGAKVSKSPSRGSIQSDQISQSSQISPDSSPPHRRLMTLGSEVPALLRGETKLFRQGTQLLVGDKTHDVRRFLLSRYNVSRLTSSDKDLEFVEELGDKICEVLPSSQNSTIQNHLNELIDAYETEYFDQIVIKITKNAKSKGKPTLEDYTSGFTSKEICLNLLSKGYFSKEQARGGIGQMVSEKILKNLSSRVELLIESDQEGKGTEESTKDEESEDRKKNFDVILLRLAKKEELEGMLVSLSHNESDKVLAIIREKLKLEIEVGKPETISKFIDADLTVEEIKKELFGSSSKGEDEKIKKQENNESSTTNDLLNSYICKLRLEVLTEMNLLDHDSSTLVELYNLLQQDIHNQELNTKIKPQDSKKTMLEDIRNLIMNIIHSYKEYESTMNKDELDFLLPLAFVEDPEIFRLFLGVFLFDFNNDILFEPKKVNMMSFILIGAIKNKGFQQYCNTDDLIACIKILKPKIEDLSIASGSVNVQEAMTSLNNILFLMSFIGAKGVKSEDINKIKDLTRYMETHLLEKAANMIKKKAKDPSLDMKRQYAIEALKRIEVTSFDKWQDICSNVMGVGNIAMNLSLGFLQAELSNIGEALMQIKDFAMKFYDSLPSSWFNDVNMLRFVIEEPIETILEELFGKKGPKKSATYTFFAAELLLSIVSQQYRKLKDKKTAAQALWFMVNGYDYKTSRDAIKLIKSVKFEKNVDMIQYATESLTKTAETASLDFSLFLKKILMNPIPKIEFEEFIQTEFIPKSQLSEKAIQEESSGKKFYLKVLLEKTPKLYTLARIQQYSEKTMNKPEVLVHLQGIKKEKENNEVFKEIIKAVANISDTAMLSKAKLKFEELLDKEASKEEFIKALDEIARSTAGLEQKDQDRQTLDYLKKNTITSLNEKIAAVKNHNTVDLFDVVENFLEKALEKVLLIQGDAGSGKTLFLHLIEERLWKKYNVLFNGNAHHKNRLPLRIILSEVRSYDKAVDGFLLQNGCSLEGLEEIKKEPVVIMFDGYDEINQNINLYNLNKLDEWEDAKVIFTSRKDNLTSLKEDYVLCFSPGKDKEKVLSYLILPINENQIKKYFDAQKRKNLLKIKAFENELGKMLEFDKKSPLPLTWACEKQIKELEVFLKSDRLKLLIDLRDKLKAMLPDITELEKEINNLKGDGTNTTSISQAYNTEITYLEKLSDPSEMDSIISDVNECLERISETEENQKITPDVLKCFKTLSNLETSKRAQSIVTCIEECIQLVENFDKKLQTWAKDNQMELSGNADEKKKHIFKAIDGYFLSQFNHDLMTLKENIHKVINYETQDSNDDTKCVKELVDSEDFKLCMRFCRALVAIDIGSLKRVSKKIKSGFNLPEDEDQSNLDDKEAQQVSQEEESDVRYFQNQADFDFEKVYNNIIEKMQKHHQNLQMGTLMKDFLNFIVKFGETKGQMNDLSKEAREYTRFHLVEAGKIEDLKKDIQQIDSFKETINYYSTDLKEKFPVVQAFQAQVINLNSYSSQKDYSSIVRKLEERKYQITTLERAIRSAEIQVLSKVRAIDKRTIELRKFTDLESIISRFKDIATCPFMLKMLLETLVKYPESSANKAKLYRLFVDIHFERERDKLIRSERIPSKFNIIDSFYQYSKDLAVNMFIRKVTAIQAKSKGYKMLGAAETMKPNVWNRFFDDTDIMTKLARRGAQILEDEGYMRFVHKSIMEYFAAKAIFDEIIDFTSDSYQDHDFCLDKVPLIETEAAVYEFIKGIAADDFERVQKELSVFDKKLLEILSTPNLCNKYQNDLDNGIFLTNIFLILLSRKDVIQKICQMKDDSPILMLVMNIFSWIFSDSEMSQKFVEAIEKAKECEDDLYNNMKPLLLLYYHITRKKGSKMNLGTDLEKVPQTNVKFKISLPPNNDNKQSSQDNKDKNETEGEIFAPNYIMQGKFFLNGSLDNLVVIKACNTGKFLMVKDHTDNVNEEEGKSIASKLTTNDTNTPWDIRESKWLLRMMTMSTFNLRSIQNHNVHLVGTFAEPEAHKAFFGVRCTCDVHTDKYIKDTFYSCSDCGSEALICPGCLEKCHKDHKTSVFKGSSGGYCDCRFFGYCKIAKGCVSRFGKGYTYPVMYTCSQCPSDASERVLCLYCKQHHEEESAHTTFQETKDGKDCQCNCISSRTRIVAQAWYEEKEYSYLEQ